MVENAFAHAWIIGSTRFVIVTFKRHIALALEWKVGLSTWMTGPPLSQATLLTGHYEQDLFALLKSKFPPRGYCGDIGSLTNAVRQKDVEADLVDTTKLLPCGNIGFFGSHPFTPTEQALFVPSPGLFAIVPVLPENPFHMSIYGLQHTTVTKALRCLKENNFLKT